MERMTVQKGGPPGGVERRRTVRDSFTMPAADHRLIRELQLTFAQAGVLLNKGEVLRAGLHALGKLPVNELVQMAEGIEHLKSGPRK